MNAITALKMFELHNAVISIHLNIHSCNKSILQLFLSPLCQSPGGSFFFSLFALLALSPLALALSLSLSLLSLSQSLSLSVSLSLLSLSLFSLSLSG